MLTPGTVSPDMECHLYGGEGTEARHRAGVGILTSPWLRANVLEFSPENERVASVQLQVTGGKALYL